MSASLLTIPLFSLADYELLFSLVKLCSSSLSAVLPSLSLGISGFFFHSFRFVCCSIFKIPFASFAERLSIISQAFQFVKYFFKSFLNFFFSACPPLRESAYLVYYDSIRLSREIFRFVTMHNESCRICHLLYKLCTKYAELYIKLLKIWLKNQKSVPQKSNKIYVDFVKKRVYNKMHWFLCGRFSPQNTIYNVCSNA